MKIALGFFLIVLSAMVLSSCDESTKKRTLPRHTGSSGEVVLVMDEDQWLGAPGDSLRTILEAFVPALPQAEPRFTLLQFAHHEMSDLLRQHRNIIFITLGPDGNDSPGVKVSRDKWSSHQIIFTINSPDEQHFYKLVQEDLNNMADIIDQTENDRLADRYQKNNNDNIEQIIFKNSGVVLYLPDDCKIAKEEKDFIWIKRERTKYLGNTAHEITQGFLVFRYPYSTAQSLEPSSILSARDSVLKRFVPGPEKGTYMTTEYRFEPENSVISKNDRYTVLTSGLWRVENYFMGGPFRSVTTLSNDQSYIVSVSGFVFAPKFDKREYIREVEAVLSTLKLN